MSTPGLSVSSSGFSKSAEQFEGFWRQLKECHLNALEELEAKVSKLKKVRCLDAQKLEEFHNNNQKLKEQNKALQETIVLLEERLRTQKCERCAVLEANLNEKQDQMLSLISKLKKEKTCFQDETRNLQSELHKLKTSLSDLQPAASSDEDVIPGTPVLHSSLPVGGKLRRQRRPEHSKRVRYEEKPLPWSGSSLFNEANTERVDAVAKTGRHEVLAPNTCVLDASTISDDHIEPSTSFKADGDSDIENRAEVIPETCALFDKPHTKTPTAPGLLSCSNSLRKHNIRLNADSTTEISPSLLSHVKRFTEDEPARQAKRKKEENSEPAGEQKAKHHTELHKRSAASSNSQQAGQVHTTDVPRWKTPVMRGGVMKVAGGGGQKGNSLLKPEAPHKRGGGEGGERRQQAAATWSIDPALVLSAYDSEPDEEEQCHAEMADSDCTWISHSVLQPRLEHGPDEEENIYGLGEKVNDSLDMMFDTTAYGQYKSFSGTQMEQSQPSQEQDEEKEEQMEEQEEEEEDAERDDCDDDTMSQRKEHKAKYPDFAHVAVIRKKDERQKLQGATCKECEAYYSHLSDEEKQKKLSACSRHRFLYVPPSTPENFWEVGFPSTQTCIDRGYIKEDLNPAPRPRRRQPFNALFSPRKTPSKEAD